MQQFFVFALEVTIGQKIVRLIFNNLFLYKDHFQFLFLLRTIQRPGKSGKWRIILQADFTVKNYLPIYL